MSQFKPMVKMFTDEPSVILKLKKGGKVKPAGQTGSFKAMGESGSHKAFDGVESGAAPKKPAMSERRKAMNPNLYAKGGKVVRKQMGGSMPVVQNPAGSNAIGVPMMRELGRQAISRFGPIDARPMKSNGRPTIPVMKKGGSTGECAKLGKELEHHESMPASKAHGKKGNAVKKAFAKGGNVVSDGKAVAMPRKPVSRPVANSLQSGTFKKGGKVAKFAKGGDTEDLSGGAYDAVIDGDDNDMEMARAIRSVPSKLFKGAKRLIGGLSGADEDLGAVTKTKESVTVAPSKKRGN